MRFIGRKGLRTIYVIITNTFYVIDVSSKLVFLIPVKTKSGIAVTTVFRSIIDDEPKKLSGGPYF